MYPSSTFIDIQIFWIVIFLFITLWNYFWIFWIVFFLCITLSHYLCVFRATLRRVKDYCEQFKSRNRLPSLVFAFTIKGKAILSEALGYSDPVNFVPATLDTPYRVASVTKTFTGLIIAILVTQGSIRYDDPVSKYLGPHIFPVKYWNGVPVEITIKQLLNHTAGLHQTEKTDYDHLAEQEQDGTFNLFKHEPLRFEPGSQYGYSNMGYQVLGKIVESVTGRPFIEAMNERIREANLQNTVVETAEVLKNHHTRYTDEAVNPADMQFDTKFVQGECPAVGIQSTAPDLAKWGNFSMKTFYGQNTVLDQATREEATRERPETPFVCGLQHGTVSLNSSQCKVAFHNGNLVGAKSLLAIFPEIEAVFAAVTNKGHIEGFDDMALFMAESLHPIIKKMDACKDAFDSLQNILKEWKNLELKKEIEDISTLLGALHL